MTTFVLLLILAVLVLILLMMVGKRTDGRDLLFEQVLLEWEEKVKKHERD